MKTPKVALFIVLGIVLLMVGAVYAIKPANALPAFFPGHDLSITIIHVKHALASFLLGLCSFIYAWFSSGPKKSA